MTMKANSVRGSATIYQFPVGGRAALGGHPHEAKPSGRLAAVRLAKVAASGAWYHEEAMQEAQRARKN
jgi:hypothetical protein